MLVKQHCTESTGKSCCFGTWQPISSCFGLVNHPGPAANELQFKVVKLFVKLWLVNQLISSFHKLLTSLDQSKKPATMFQNTATSWSSKTEMILKCQICWVYSSNSSNYGILADTTVTMVSRRVQLFQRKDSDNYRLA